MNGGLLFPRGSAATDPQAMGNLEVKRSDDAQHKVVSTTGALAVVTRKYTITKGVENKDIFITVRGNNYYNNPTRTNEEIEKKFAKSLDTIVKVVKQQGSLEDNIQSFLNKRNRPFTAKTVDYISSKLGAISNFVEIKIGSISSKQSQGSTQNAPTNHRLSASDEHGKRISALRDADFKAAIQEFSDASSPLEINNDDLGKQQEMKKATDDKGKILKFIKNNPEPSKLKYTVLAQLLSELRNNYLNTKDKVIVAKNEKLLSPVEAEKMITYYKECEKIQIDKLIADAQKSVEGTKWTVNNLDSKKSISESEWGNLTATVGINNRKVLDLIGELQKSPRLSDSQKENLEKARASLLQAQSEYEVLMSKLKTTE